MAHGHGGFEFIHHSDPNSPSHIKHPTLKEYWVTYFALLALLVVTVALYLYTNFGPAINIVMAMAVAILKAFLVVRNFMNVKGGTKLIFLWAVLGFIWFILMFGIFMDYLTRQWVDQSGWQPLPYMLR
jgi:caa(3)-type oxidase subunit IV